MCRWRSALNYLAGLVYGDGSIYYYERNKQYFIYVYDSDKDFLEKVGRELKKALGSRIEINYWIIKPDKSKRYYRLQISNKDVYLYLKKLLSERPQCLTKNFVRGLVDAEGTVYADKKGRVSFELGVTDGMLASKILTWLQRKGIRATLTSHRDKRGNRKILYKIRVRGWDNVERLLLFLRPLHPKLLPKFEALKRMYGKA